VRLVKLGASTVSKETGAPLWQAVSPITDGVNDVDSLGEIDAIQCLGVMANPAAADEKGHAEGLVEEGVGGLPAVALGGRDTRVAKLAGTLKPGDTVLHSTGPSQSALVMCKESKRQVVLATKNKRDETQAIVLDGAAEKLQIAVNGCMFEIADGGFTLTDASGRGSIMVRNGVINLIGTVVVGGITPLFPLAAVNPAAPTVPVPVPGAFMGS